MSLRIRPQCVEDSERQHALADAADGFDAGAIWENRLWVGSLSAARDEEALSSRGITAVLTMAGNLKVWESGARPSCVKDYLKVDIADHPCASLFDALPAAIAFLDEHLSRESGVSVLVHCASGVSRSVSACVAWLVSRKGLSFDNALTQVRTGRPLGNPNAGFRLQLQQLERHPGSVEDARTAYQAQIAATGAVSLQDVLADQRGTANSLHARADTLEEAIKSEPTADASTKSWRDDLQELERDIHNVSASFEQHAVQDRPARMIAKSAASKVSRLLADVESMSVHAPM